jgi:predicted O-linked N-acetylglucosamine transferase (SPINDLY family)
MSPKQKRPTIPSRKQAPKGLNSDKECASLLQEALPFHQKGRLQEARELYQNILSLNPKYFDALHLLAVLEGQSGDHVKAFALFDEAIKINGKSAALFNNRGTLLKEFKRHEEALASCDEAIRLKPEYAEAFYNRGNALNDLKRYDEALASYEQAIRLKPEYAEAFNNRGNLLNEFKRHEDALASCDEAIRLKPEYAEAFNNRGNALNELKRFDEALASYEQAIRFKPDFTEAFNNRGIALNELKRYEEALASCDEAIRLKPEYAEAFNNRGAPLNELERYDEALASFEQALRLKPDYEFVQGFVAFLSNRICHWAALEVSIAKIADDLSAGIAISDPFPVLSLLDAPELHKKASLIWVQKKVQPSGLLGSIPAAQRNEKIHLAYLSADFHEHATSYLMAELFELHDRSRFELTAISFGPPTDKPIGDRLQAAFDRFIDVRQRSDLDVARLCREMEVDIAVDLKGYTRDSRPGILAERCAPVQINWLGYPGSMAAPFIDYLVADPALITQDDLQHYSEKVIWLPHTYQVNDRTRKISDKVFTRLECGLPEKGFVFCCFNNNYKILPATFAIWMRLLHRVPGSVLWLLEDNPTASKNLRQEAQARGVDPSRLVFAPRWPLAEHLARHRLADLFIDTWPYNAHTTASDALWAGLPLVTRSGKSFASRVAASLLKAVGLEELITDSDDAYEALAIKLAQHPQDLQASKKNLQPTDSRTLYLTQNASPVI